MHPKEADAMANSVDPDQTASSEAVWSWSALFAETYLSQYIEFLRYWKLLKSLLSMKKMFGSSALALGLIIFFWLSQWYFWPLKY